MYFEKPISQLVMVKELKTAQFKLKIPNTYFICTRIFKAVDGMLV